MFRHSRHPRRHPARPRWLLAALASAIIGAATTSIAATPASGPAGAEAPVRLFAAASLTDALTAIAHDWQRQGHPAPSLAFAASSTLARQIDAGAPADIYASADTRWMDYLQMRNRIDTSSRRELLSTGLVLIAPLGPVPAIRMEPGFPIAAAFRGKLCTGDTSVVPVGIYARQALQKLGWWQPLQGRIVGTDDVRAALAFVERGECALGIVYATDALISQQVQVVATFPAATHTPVTYSFALLEGATPAARRFYAMLGTPMAAATFQRYGFRVRPRG